jgi:hypothetical protein
MERWCAIYADDAGRLVIENHNASGVDVKVRRTMPFWRLTLPFRCYPAKVRVI